MGILGRAQLVSIFVRNLWFVSGRTCLKDVPVMPPSSLTLEFRPVTPDRLADLARFSRHHGKFRYCSCMRWRMRSSEFSRSTTQTRATALDDLVHAGTADRGSRIFGRRTSRLVLRGSQGDVRGPGTLSRLTTGRPLAGVVRGLLFRRSSHTQEQGDARVARSGGGLRPFAGRRGHRRISSGARRPALHLHGLAERFPRRRLPGCHASWPNETRHEVFRRTKSGASWHHRRCGGKRASAIGLAKTWSPNVRR